MTCRWFSPGTPTIKLTANIVESGVKHHKPTNQPQRHWDQHLCSEYTNVIFFLNYTPGGGGGYTVLPLSVLPSVQDIFCRIFLSNYRWQKSDIWSQASYRYAILWVAFLDPSDSSLPVWRLSWFLYTLNIYAHFSSHFSQQLLMTQIWYLVTSFISVPHIVGSVLWPVRFLLPVCRLSWLLYTFNIYSRVRL